MDQVFRIEIPVEAVDKTDTAALQHLESVLQKLFTAMKQNKSSANEVFDAIERGATKANSSLNNTAANAEKVGTSYEQAADSAENAGNAQKSAAQTAENATEKLEDSVSETSDAYKDTGEAAQGAGQKSGSAFTQAASNTDKFTQRVEKSQTTLRNMFKEKFQLIMAAVDRASPVLKTIWNTAKSIAAKTWHVAVRMKDFITAPFKKLYSMITSPITIALSVAGIGLSASDIASTYNDFETGMSAVKALTGATNAEFITLKETAKELGASTSFSASEASEGMQYLAMAGWDTSEIVAAMPGLLDLAAAGATDLGTAADIVSDVMTAMGMSADEASRAADVFAKTATSSNTTIEGLGETMKYAAPIAHSFGMSLEEVSALAGLMANAGIKGSQAGTALRASLLRMSAPTSEMQKTMKQLGISFTDSSGNMKKSNEIVSMLSKSFSGLSESQRLEAAQTLFGTEAASAWLGVINQGPEAYDAMTNSLNNCAGAAEEMANIRLDNLSGDLEELGGVIETAKLELMEKLNPYIRQGVQWITGKIPQIQAKLESAIDTVIEKGTSLVSFLKDVFNSDEYQNADGFAEKFFVAWDKIIAEPFAEWWDNGGQDTILSAVGELGSNIGKVLHGIVVGIFAALKGEEIDFEGLNLTGIAKAGAETAKSFVSSFMESFDLGNVASEMPGVLKAGLLGFGAIKLGQGGLGIYKVVSGLKAAFTGVSAAAGTAATATAAVGQTAATAAVGVSKSAVVLGGLKTALAAIPVWGWVAAAALAAVAIGVKLYTDEQKRQKEEILNLSETMRQHTAEYRQEADEINSITGAVETLHEIKINATYEGPGPQEMQDLQTQLAMLGSRENQLEYLIQNGGTDEQIASWQAELDAIHTSQAAAAQKLADLKQQVTDVISLVAELNSLEDPDITITATLNKWGITDEADIQLIKDLASSITTKTGLLMETLAKVGMSYEDFQELTGLADDVESKSGILSERLSRYGLTKEEFAALTDLSTSVTTASGIFSEELAWYGLSATEWADLVAYGDTVGTESGEFSERLWRYGLTTTDFAYLTGLSADVSSAAGTLSERLSRYGLTVADFNELTALSDDVETSYGYLSERLSRYGLTVEQFNELTALADDVESDSGLLMEILAKYGLGEEEFKEVCALADEVKTKTGILTVKTQLEGYGLTVLGIAALSAQVSSMNNQEIALKAYLDKETSLTADQITAYVEELKANSQREIEIEALLTGSQLTYREIASLNTELTAIKNRKIELDVAVNGGNATQAQIDEYLGLSERQATIELMLSGTSLTPEEIGALTEEFEGLQSADAEIYVHMSESGLDDAAVAKVASDIASIGDKSAKITVTVTHTDENAAEAAEQARQEIFAQLAPQLNDYFGLNLTPEQLASGQYDGLISGIDSGWQRDQQEALLLRSQQEVAQQGERVIPGAQSLISENQAEIARLQQANEQQSAALSPGAELLSAIDLWGARYDAKMANRDSDFAQWQDTDYKEGLWEPYWNYVQNNPETSWVSEQQAREQFEGFTWTGESLHDNLFQMFGDSSVTGHNTVGWTAEEIEANNARIAALQAEIDQAESGMVATYDAKRQNVTDEQFLGSNLFGKPIEEIAASYSTLDEAGKAMFADAVAALETLNQQTDYIGEDKKTQASDVVDLAAKSEIMASIQTQVEAISTKYGQMSTEQLTALNGTEEAAGVLSNINAALAGLGIDTQITSMTEIASALEAIKNVDMSTFSVEGAQKAIEALTGDANSSKTSVDALRTALNNLDGTTATTTLNQVTNKVTNYSSNGSPGNNANGGIYDGAFLSWVAEDGPEAIIPLGAKRRDRGLDLWLQAGEMLGVSEFAEGGIVAPYAAELDKLPDDVFDDSDGDNPKPVSTGGNGGGGNTFSVNVSANPVFQIDGGESTDDIMDKLKAKQKELAEILGSAFAEQLEDIVSNMT